MLNVDRVIDELKNLKQGENDKYYDDIYLKTQEILNGDYTEEDRQRLRNTGRLEVINMLTTY